MTAVHLVRRFLSLAALTATALIVAASPAAAAPGDRYWFYWVAPLLALAAIGLVVALGIGYYVRVIRPKYRGR